ncbi:hypothetical protein Taro_040852 [Colocasia esculenta]|uniref:Uncharacterized protein n=1 Tax=Colocasia esculenta TaxID=4460 RepID=A0A843WU70_COLES|nr:hypothetical protein [Colocasia esculenta]
MVRAPCCEKMGLKKGPWTPEEDQILVSHIERYGHGNWRALPRLAGLLRCGKSCRLRWMNYLRPDIKRGSFSKEEEDAIINLHELLGNRWSAIAAKLPGRTDNEIKNVWHTHLKKRVKPSPASQQTRKRARRDAAADMESKPITLQIDPSAAAPAYTRFEGASPVPTSPPQSCSELSSSASTDCSTATGETNPAESVKYGEYTDSSDKFLDMDESFWSEALSTLDDSAASLDFATPYGSLPLDHVGQAGGYHGFHTDASSGEDDADFWLRVFMQAGGQLQLPGF